EPLLREPPARWREHHLVADYPRKELRCLQRPPAPGEVDDALLLKRAEEAVDAETATVIVVRARQPRDHLAAEALRAEHHAGAFDGDQEIGDWDVTFAWRA